MAKHKMVLDDIFEEVSYSLIAIHCSAEDYRLAYALNKCLSVNLKRKHEDLDVNNVSSIYSIYEWEDMDQLTTWNLVSNVCKKEADEQTNSNSLFGENDRSMTTYNLISEHKNVDFLLKIDSNGGFINEKNILNKLLEISFVVTAYSIDASKLKSRTNLIFN